ncbi:sulfotransferase family protein [Sphingosinicella terrae]|uniref:sulfotransferase family protein n=1 Tax=Sphingosinicella terrae TaxID=2172047 RepID=UPI000E0CDA4E|nr:sulfotransferase [Sphingosinicella terrae]
MTAPSPLPNVRKANSALEALWRSGLSPRPRLTAEALEAAALAGAPRRALGDDSDWREPFERLVRSLREEAELSPLGETMAHGQIVMTLRARMRAVRLWERHHDILERPVRAPVVVLGQMRSGTTRVQRLLACDPRFAHSRTFESLMPVPLRPKPGRRDPRRLRARVGLAVLRALNPEIGRIHPTAPDAAEEEFGLLSYGFGATQFEAQWRVPAFSRWWEEADRRPLYRAFKTLLQTNGWYRGDDPARPWLLKAPQFLQDLPALLDAFPDARLICLDRPAGQVVASSCSLVWNQMRVQSDGVDPGWIGREWLGKTRLRERIAEQALAARPDVPRIRVSYEAMNRDWRGETARIYQFLGMELTPDLLARMHAYLAGAKAHLGHRYSLDDFGLGAADLAAGAMPRRDDARQAAR